MKYRYFARLRLAARPALRAVLAVFAPLRLAARSALRASRLAARPAVRRLRGAFSLLEAMIAAAILVLTLVIIGRIQAAAVDGALRAERLAVATELAQEKMAEVTFFVEHEGVGSEDVYERGNFSDFGTDVRLDFGDSLDEYRWEYWIEEIEFEVSGDLFSMLGGGEEGAGGAGGQLAQNGMAQQAMGMMGMGPDQLNEQLQRFIRRTRVRVYWGDSREATERGREVILTNHLVKPMGFPAPMPGQNGGGGGGGGGGPRPGGGGAAAPGGNR